MLAIAVHTHVANRTRGQWGEPYGVTVHKKRGILIIHQSINQSFIHSIMLQMHICDTPGTATRAVQERCKLCVGRVQVVATA
jgi:hypothetical protein